DRHATNVLGPPAGGAHDLQHALERARPLLDQSRAVGGSLPGHEQQPPAGRRQQAVIPAAGTSQCIGVHDPKCHRLASPPPPPSPPPPAPPTPRPLVCPRPSAHSPTTARATSSGEVSPPWPAAARAAP